jgi:hypothetical protein
MNPPITDLEYADELLDLIEGKFTRDWAEEVLDQVVPDSDLDPFITSTQLESKLHRRLNLCRWEVEQRVKAIRQRIADESEASRDRAAELIGES